MGKGIPLLDCVDAHGLGFAGSPRCGSVGRPGRRRGAVAIRSDAKWRVPLPRRPRSSAWWSSPLWRKGTADRSGKQFRREPDQDEGKTGAVFQMRMPRSASCARFGPCNRDLVLFSLSVRFAGKLMSDWADDSQGRMNLTPHEQSSDTGITLRGTPAGVCVVWIGFPCSQKPKSEPFRHSDAFPAGLCVCLCV